MSSQTQTSTKKILIATLITLVIATVLLVTTVLPAEFNIDPLKTGKLLGIAGMSEEQLVGALNRQTTNYQQDVYTTTLEPYERLEYKYRLNEGGSLLFEWQASGELIYDMHSEKDGVDPQQYSPSFDQGQSTGEMGSYTALFSGIHGWFFENRSTSPVELKLKTSGFFSQSTEFRGGFENHRQFAADN